MGRVLVLVVFAVGCVGGVAGFRYLQENPETLERLGVELPGVVALVQPAECPPVTLASLQEAEAAVWELYCNVPTPAALDQKSRDALSGTVQELVAGFAEFLSQEPDPAELRAAQELSLRARFVGAKLAPATFATEFRSFAQEVIAEAEHPGLAVQADAYAVLESISVEQPIDTADLERLEAFVSKHPQSPLGATLFAYVADGLWRNRQAESAEAVLQRGIQRFAGQPPVSQLVNQLVDQGHREPPPPRWTETEWNSLNRAVGALASRSSGGTATSAACGVKRG